MICLCSALSTSINFNGVAQFELWAQNWLLKTPLSSTQQLKISSSISDDSDRCPFISVIRSLRTALSTHRRWASHVDAASFCGLWSLTVVVRSRVVYLPRILILCKNWCNLCWNFPSCLFPLSVGIRNCSAQWCTIGGSAVYSIAEKELWLVLDFVTARNFPSLLLC